MWFWKMKPTLWSSIRSFRKYATNNKLTEPKPSFAILEEGLNHNLIDIKSSSGWLDKQIMRDLHLFYLGKQYIF